MAPASGGNGQRHLMEREKSFEEARSAVKNQMEKIFQKEAAGPPKTRQPVLPPVSRDRDGKHHTLTRRSNSTSRHNMSSLSGRHRSMDSLAAGAPPPSAGFPPHPREMQHSREMPHPKPRNGGTLTRRRPHPDQQHPDLKRSVSHNSLAGGGRMGSPVKRGQQHPHSPPSTSTPHPPCPPALGPMSLFESYPFMPTSAVGPGYPPPPPPHQQRYPPYGSPPGRDFSHFSIR